MSLLYMVYIVLLFLHITLCGSAIFDEEYKLLSSLIRNVPIILLNF
jgi:hypothetical protein